MPANSYSLDPIVMRSTTGQRVTVFYDRGSNAQLLIEDDWFEDGHRSTGVPSPVTVRQALPRPGSPLRAVRLPRRAA